MSDPVPAALKPIRRVLCAIDLSPITPHVLSVAAEVAEAYEAALTVLHVVEVWDSRYDFIVSDLIKRVESEAREKLQAELAHLGKSHPVPVEVLVEKGSAPYKILEAIRQRRPDLVVMGMQGARGLDHMLLGSVVDKVLRVSPVSVLGVRPPKNPDIRTILCAVDFSPCSQLALQRALELARLEKLPAIKVLNVYEIPLGFMEAGMTSETAARRIEAVHRSQMEELLRPLKCAVECEAVFREGAAAPAIAAYAEEAGADLLVIGSHGRSSLAAFLLGSTSSRVLHQAGVPVLAVKSPSQRETLWQALDKL